MAKQIKFNYKDVEYTLEFNRESIVEMASRGFDYTKLESTPVMMLDLFEGAFGMHHPGIEEDLVAEIYSRLPDKKRLLKALVEMYVEPAKSLFDEPTEGNVGWTQNW